MPLTLTRPLGPWHTALTTLPSLFSASSSAISVPLSGKSQQLQRARDTSARTVQTLKLPNGLTDYGWSGVTAISPEALHSLDAQAP